MFYENQPTEQQEQYKLLLGMMGRLSNLFSESDCPYLAYRVHENIFCKSFQADNLARGDDSADAQKGNIGIGLKTWTGQNDQKVAEFGRLLPQYENLTGIDLVRRISEFRNLRIRTTMNQHGINTMLYHVVKRVPNMMKILECSFDPVDVDNIELIPNRGNASNIYFTDHRHTYHFSQTKHTLYMIFDDLQEMDSFPVEILSDPYSLLVSAIYATKQIQKSSSKAPDIVIPGIVNHAPINIEIGGERVAPREQLCLRLYTRTGKNTGRQKYVQEKSGLNQWNASGRPRDPDEIYIPYPAEDRRRNENFFPPRETPFNLRLPDGTVISAKVCQENGKAIMSNPNKVLGKWLLRDVFELPERTLITYDMLVQYGIDSVVFTKFSDSEYSVDFSDIGTYEEFYEEDE